MASSPKATLRKKARAIFQRAIKSNLGQRTIVPCLRFLDMAGRLAIRTRIGAWLAYAIMPDARPVFCAACLTDRGLKFEADRVGILNALACPNCGARGTKKLTPYLAQVLASRFFVRGSVHRFNYGAAPLVQFNEVRVGDGDYEGPPWLRSDIELIGEKARIGLFHYGPRLWMVGEIEPLKALQDEASRKAIVDRILREYPSRTLSQSEPIYRLRVNPTDPIDSSEYDSPPDSFLGRGRLDSPALPILYCSQDIEGCVHECRVTVEDDLFLAALVPTRDIRLLDLTELLDEDVTEFESLDLAVHMLFFASAHSYEITREIAVAARQAGFDGLIYPSYFSQVRSGAMPLETAGYGLSVRRFPRAAGYAKSSIFPNVALFGRPVREKVVEVSCINRLVLHKVHYDIQFGPAREKLETMDDDLGDKDH